MKIGLALGSGSARGLAHIGVINALAQQGITPDVICGTSIGSLVGAAFVCGNLDRLENWVRALNRLETARFFELNFSQQGFVNIERFHAFLNQYIAEDDLCIESLRHRYGAVATELETGREVWFTEGPLLQAVWASISLPGLFPAIRHDNNWLVDGGLVNPVPVSLCRALGADVVIAVNLNGDIIGRHLHKLKSEETPRAHNGVIHKLTELVGEYTTFFNGGNEPRERPPSMFDAIAGSINIIQDRITRSRMAGDPPDILITPRLAHIGLLEFYRAREAIREGERAVEAVLPSIHCLVQR
jgi:NTE family protein